MKSLDADKKASKTSEAVPKSKKLLKFTLNDGTDKKRTILSGIHEYSEPEQLVGKTCNGVMAGNRKRISICVILGLTKAELKGNLTFLYDVFNNYKYNWNNEMFFR